MVRWLVMGCIVCWSQVLAAPVAVSVVSVEQRSFAERVTALGSVLANESVDLKAKLTERVTGIYFDDGEVVQAGQLLLQLDEAEVQAELRQAQALLQERQRAYQRAAELIERQVGTSAEYDVAEARVAQSQAEIAAIKARVANHQLRAPFTGVMGLRTVSVGALLDQDRVLATLDDLSQVKVDFAVPVRWLSQLQPGLALAGRTSAYAERRFLGQVQSIASRVDRQTRTVLVRALLPNPDQALRPGMLLEVELALSPRLGLGLPEAAVSGRSDRALVFVLLSGATLTVEERQVSLGRRAEGWVEVLSGLTLGEQVVHHGGLKLRQGTEVRLIKAAEPSL